MAKRTPWFKTGVLPEYCGFYETKSVFWGKEVYRDYWNGSSWRANSPNGARIVEPVEWRGLDQNLNKI